MLNEDRWAANGTAPDGKFLGMAGIAINHCVAYRRKLVCEHAFTAEDIPAGIATDPAEVMHVGFHSGVGAHALVGVFCLAPADAAATDPYVTMVIRNGYTGGSVTVASPELHYGGAPTGWSDTPDNISWGHKCSVAITADTDYRVWLRLYDYARVLSCAIYEIGNVPVDTDSRGVDPRRGCGSPVYDGDMQQYIVSCSQQWRHNAGNVLQFIAYDDGTERRSIVMNTYGAHPPNYYNIFDGSTTTVSASTIGYRINLAYHNSVAQTAVPVVMAVYAEGIDTGGEVSAYDPTDNIVRLTDGTNTIDLNEIDALGWYTTTGTMPASDDQKWDIHGSTGEDANMRIYSVCVYELD